MNALFPSSASAPRPGARVTVPGSLPSEQWRSCPSYPGLSASSLGRVFRECPKNGERLLGFGFGTGVRLSYRGVCGLIDPDTGKRRQVYVHRLVADAFLGPAPFARALVMHLNDDPSDNRPENLSWGSQSDNASTPAARAARSSARRFGGADRTRQGSHLRCAAQSSFDFGGDHG